MKRFLPIFLAVFIIILSVTPVFASSVYSKIPQPEPSSSDFYFVLGSTLLHFVFPNVVNEYQYEASTGNSSYSYSPYMISVECVPNENYQGYWNLKFKITNNLPLLSVTCRIYKYYISDGSYAGSESFPIGAESSYTFQWTPLPDSAIQGGYWCSSNIHITGVGFQNFPLKQIAWSDTIDYSSDFGQLETLISATNSYLNSIESRFISFDTYLRSHFDIELSEIEGYILILYSEFVEYRSDFNQEAETIEGQLDEIISLLGGGQTTQVLDPETGFANSVDEYQSEEDSLLNGVDDRVNEMNDLVSSADDRLEGLSDGFILVRNVFNHFIEEQPLPFTLLFFSLVFGLFITIIGKKVA